jgi:hypothetical protein
VPLFSVRRAGIETFARELEARGRARATVTRRLCTMHIWLVGALAGQFRAIGGYCLGFPPSRTAR